MDNREKGRLMEEVRAVRELQNRLESKGIISVREYGVHCGKGLFEKVVGGEQEKVTIRDCTVEKPQFQLSVVMLGMVYFCLYSAEELSEYLKENGEVRI